MSNLIRQCHAHVKRVLKKDDVAIDCTVGNGNDTVFLANIVGKNGLIIGFDVQKNAINSTKNNLIKNNVEAEVCLICENHANILENVDSVHHKKIKVIMFNLGYLPGGDKTLVTTPENTILAFDGALKILKKGGSLVVMVYVGHPGGENEWLSIQEWFCSLDENNYNLSFLVPPEQKGPKVFFIRKESNV